MLLVKRIFILLIVLCSLILADVLFASPMGNYTLFDVDYLSTDAYKYLYKRDPYEEQYNGKWTAGGQLNLGLRAVEVFRIDANIHADSAFNQVRNVGLHYKVSMDKWAIQPFWEHESDHSTDTEGAHSPNSSNDYPIYDRYGLSIIWKDKRKNR